MKPAEGAKFALFVLFAINALNFFDRALLGVLAEPIRRAFLLSDTGLGLLGTIFTLVYAIVGLPLGRLADRWSRKRLIALGTLAWSLLTAATGFAMSYTQMFAARLGVGLGEAAFAPAAQSLIGDLFPTTRRALAMGIFMLGLPAGIFLAYASAGIIYEHFGWRSAFYLACLPGLLFAALVLLVREPQRGAQDASVRSAATPLIPERIEHPFRKVLSVPTMWWIILSGIFHNFNTYALNSFNTAFLQRFHGMSLRDAGNASSIAVGAVGAIGLLLGGWIADRLSVKHRNARLLVAATSMAIAAPCIFFALNQPQGAIGAYIVLMACGTSTMYVYFSTVYTSIQDVIEPRLRGTAVAIYFCCMYILGASLGPLGTGLLSDHFATKAMRDAGAGQMTDAFKAIGLHDAMYAIPVLALAAAAVLYAASRTVEQDVHRQALAHHSAPA